MHNFRSTYSNFKTLRKKNENHPNYKGVNYNLIFQIKKEKYLNVDPVRLMRSMSMLLLSVGRWNGPYGPPVWVHNNARW